MPSAIEMIAIGMGFNSPATSSMTSRLTSADDQGGTLGLAASLGSLGRVVGPAFGGFLYDIYGPRTPYVTAATLMAITALVAVIGFRSREAHQGGDPRAA